MKATMAGSHGRRNSTWGCCPTTQSSRRIGPTVFYISRFFLFDDPALSRRADYNRSSNRHARWSARGGKHQCDRRRERTRLHRRLRHARRLRHQARSFRQRDLFHLFRWQRGRHRERHGGGPGGKCLRHRKHQSSLDFPVTKGAYASTGASFLFQLNPDGSVGIFDLFRVAATPITVAVDAAGSAYLAGSRKETCRSRPERIRRPATAASSARIFRHHCDRAVSSPSSTPRDPV